ncbi:MULTISPECIES: Mov34/MPN/PAD-1 family protein [Mesorhizobium]|uniref:Mov34/MPN/PAD-1 family protein n=1 Tax=Mesorhizobium TaxID=68287 RepID=UPI0010A972F4|nr:MULTISPECIES: Mov34/MPN/PAD-1 family protein [Mesorhizobium]
MIRGWSQQRYAMVAPVVLATIGTFLIGDERRSEAGGILIGSYRGSHVEVVGCTVPMPLDLRSRYCFDRRDPGHQAAALKAWHASGRTETFVGEWHTHPEPHPTPSGRDRQTWADIMKKNSNPLVFLIGGWESFWWGVGERGLIVEAVPLDSEPSAFLAAVGSLP